MPSKKKKQEEKRNDNREEKRLLTLFAEDIRAFTHRDTLGERNKLKSLIDKKMKGLDHKGLNEYVVELIHRCPNFLEEQDGFEWIPRRHKAVLQGARMVHDSAKTYWDEILPAIRKGILPSGMVQLPKNRERDFLQAALFHILKTHGLGTSQAIDQIIQMYGKLKPKDQKEIYRALERVSLQVGGTWTDLVYEQHREPAKEFHRIMEEASNQEETTPAQETFMEGLSEGLKKEPEKQERLNARGWFGLLGREW